jgi:hypothetical protein
MKSLAVFIALVALLLPPIALAQAPSTITYQGRIDSAGFATKTPKNLTFAVYNVSIGGAALWTETHANVGFTNGLFTVQLGTITPFPATLFTDTGERWLGVTVAGASEMVPRALFRSSPYALRAATADNVADNAVTAAKIVDGSVGAAEIADNAVTTAKIAANTIVSADLATGAVTTSAIADAAVTTAKILDGGVGTADIADNAVTSAKIAASTIVSADLATGAVATSNIADAAVTGAKIADLTITAADVLDNSLTAAKIVPNIVSSVDGVSNDGGNIDFVAGTGITITPNDLSKTITITNTAPTAIGPIAFAHINTDGTKLSGTANVSSVWNASATRYEITIAGESYFYSTYVTTVTPTMIGIIASTSSVSGKLLVYCNNVSGAAVQAMFQFVTFKP